MKVSWLLVLVSGLLNQAAAQESIDILSLIVSEANSVYTQVNSILSSAASAASAAAASSRSSSTATSSATDTSTSADSSALSSSSSTSPDTTSSSQTSSTSTYSSAVFGETNTLGATSTSTSHTSSHSSSANPSSRFTSSTLSTPVVGTSSVLGAAAETSTSSPVASGSKHNSNLAIILGCVLGGLALGFFLLALVLCCRRRRRHGSSVRHSALSVGDDEIDAWRGDQAAVIAPRRGSSRHSRGLSGAAPLMAEHPAYRAGGVHENPFVPVPPPPRRTPFKSRPDLTHDAVPAENPFTDEAAQPSGYGALAPADDSHHHKGGVAASIAAAAVGAGLMHAHDKHKHEDDEATLTNEKTTPEPGVHRRFSRKPVPVSTVNDSEPWPYDPVSPVDPSAETAILARPPGRASGESRRSFSRDAARANATFDQEYAPEGDQQRHGHGHGLEAGMAGLAAGAVGAAAVAHHRNSERRRSRSSSSSRHSRSRPPIAATGHDSDHSSSSGASRESRNSRFYSDALATQPHDNDHDTSIPAQNDLYGVPLAGALAGGGPRSSPRNSTHGAGPVFAHANRPTVPSPLSSEVRHDEPPRSRTRRSSSAPRYSFPYDPTIGYDYSAYPAFPGASHNVNFGPPQNYNNNHGGGPAEYFPPLAQQDVPGPNTRPDKAIVGDNGYPHMGLPRRKSGGEYDLGATGPLGPQSIPTSPEHSAPSSRNTTMKSDATWRMSDGMPGGWQRSSLDGGSAGLRDSGVGMNAGRRRLRASDIAGAGSEREDGYGQAL